ncbi:unnamed protein product [Acanthoscelides obtectus]|uniref:Uncharacterized protein n=1 Tax=Acanthoscelides obtectus TaxID=200917 RepID=A0A9P0K2I1_ACAOB|nr:unnamed protein product [Acanthoscelides obtectus]CAK1648097.1 hypothetical protein AOBTE_LOCUS15539 [Acanthoscelides obtectus]
MIWQFVSFYCKKRQVSTAPAAKCVSISNLSMSFFSGRSSKIVKKVIIPFLLGLKFKTAVLVPLALALIALKTWKALTLSLLSLVLTGTISVFSKFVSKAPAYEVLHYSQPHVDYHHVDVPVPAVAYGHPVYAGRELSAQDIAYSAHAQ